MSYEIEHYSCVECGHHITIDEDGLCVNCGGETTIEKCGDCSRSYVAVCRERDELRAEVEQINDAAEMLWVVIANVSGGDWSKQHQDWQDAARRWSDHYHNVTKHRRDKISGVPDDEAEKGE